MTEENIYLVVGIEDGLQSSIWPESQLLKGVLSAVWGDPDNADQEEREHWETSLADPQNWTFDHAYFRQGIGEIAELEIYLITDASYFTSKLDQMSAALNVTASTAESLAALKANQEGRR